MADVVDSEMFLIAFAWRGRHDMAYAEAGPWLYGIASNLIARHYRAEQRRLQALARVGSTDVSEGYAGQATVRLDAQSRPAALAAALAEISAADRDVLLVAWADLTSIQARKALGIPAGKARCRLHQARKQIRAASDQVSPTNMTLEEH
jgi:RNA polymerase sigma-70 factor (ECF subfamily)